MARNRLIATLGALLAAVLCAPPSAQARTPCAGEQLAPTAANAAQVGDAIACLTNQIRAHHRLPLLRRDDRLDAAAMLHSRDMGVRDFFDHTNPDGLNPSARATAQGYAAGAGENIAHGYPNARSVVLGWMASAAHCRNVLSSAADLGVGVAVTGRPYYTQAFGDYSGGSADEVVRSACPLALDLDALMAAPAPAAPSVRHALAPAQPPAAVPSALSAARLSLRGLSLSPRRFAARGRGTTIRFRLSSPATVTFRVQPSAAGRPGSTWRRVTRRGTTGANRVRFRPSAGSTSLRPGRYRLEVVATDAAGESKRAVRSFVATRR